MKKKFICRGKFRSLIINKNGFILPFTLFLFFLFSTILLHSTTKYVVEKQVFDNFHITYELETLLLMAYQDVEKAYESENFSNSGKLEYDVGYVLYRVKEEKENGLLVSFECYTDDEGELFMDLMLDKKTEEVAPEPEPAGQDQDTEFPENGNLNDPK